MRKNDGQRSIRDLDREFRSEQQWLWPIYTEEEGMVKRKRLTIWEREGKTVDSGLRGEGGNAIPLSLCFFL